MWKITIYIERTFKLDVCKTLTNNKYDINFMNKGVNDVLDEVVESFESIEKKKEDMCKFFDKYVNIGEGKGKTLKNMTKIHFTDKGAMYMY